MRRFLSYILFVSLFVPLVNLFPTITASAQDTPQLGRADINNGIRQLKSDTGGAALVATNGATGAARFVRMSSGKMGGDFSALSGGKTAAEKSINFFRSYGSAFGIRNPAGELKLAASTKDSQAGAEHLTYNQVYMGVPVFAGTLKTHFDKEGNLYAVNGNFIPNIALNAVPSRGADQAAVVAIETVKAGFAQPSEAGAVNTDGISAKNGTLYIYRTNLARGIPGQNHLVWEIEVTNGANVRQFVYVDAHSGKVVDQLTGIHDDMYRRAYDGGNLNGVPPSYPGTPFWEEGQAFPTANQEANNMITSSKEVYDFFKNAFNRDSFDNAGTKMDAIFNRGYSCPNASWNGTFISFCAGLTTDDVTAHEWGHAYTQYTHGLIYAHQPGALNESYSDVWGETVDRINGRDNVGNSATDPVRTDGACAINGVPPPVLTISNSATANGTYFARASVNEPARPFTKGPTAMALASPAGACSAVTGVSGKIAIVDWTLTNTGANQCGSGARAQNALNAGATAIIFVAPASGLLNLGSLNTIASVEVTNADGAAIKAGLPGDATMTLGTASDTSTRWLLGEDDTGALPNALRDMWNPRCFGNPGKVSDIEYTCNATANNGNDQGGVHNNSGVPNHAYALIVDGGTYNGQTITGIGLTKAAHIYYRAMTVYQHSASNFSDHADAIEQSAQDFITAGTNLKNLTDGSPSGQVVTAADLAEIQKAMLAVEMRSTNSACNFPPILAQSPPADTCNTGTQRTLFSDDFEGDTSNWAVSGVGAGGTGFATLPNWTVSSELPRRAGKGFFVENASAGNSACASAAVSEAGVRSLTSPAIHIPASVTAPIVRFDHVMASEAAFDGGQLMLSVNNGAFTLVPDNKAVYNATNTALATVAQGSDNPRAGQRAWSGSDGGRVDSVWGTSVYDLSGLVSPGDDIKLRWDFSNDACGGTFGWYVDNVKVSACLADTDLSIVKKASSPSTLIGNNITYTLTVKNNGPTTATSVVINDTLPTGLSWISSPDGCTAAGSLVTCNIGDMANGATAVRHIVAKTTKAGRIVNTATLSQFEPDTVVPGNNSGGAAVNVLAAIRSLTFTPGSVTGGSCGNSVGKVLLNAAAPAGGLDVLVASSDPDVQIVGPTTLHFNQGDTFKTFNVTTSPVTANKTVSLTAKVVGTITAVTGKLTLTRVPLTTVTFNPNPVQGGSPTTGTVTLSCAAPYNITVTLLSNKTAAKPQAQVIIPQGATSAPFTVTTKPVLSQTAVTITAKGNGSTKTGTLTLTP